MVERMRNLITFSGFVLLGFLSLSSAHAQTILAPTPPMGWNSWDSYGLTVTEAQFRENAAIEAAKLKAVGFKYAVVDEGWYVANPEDANQEGKATVVPEVYRTDANGRYQPSLNRFPSAQGTNGFAPLAAWVHAQGLKFGIHIIRGISKQAVSQNLPVAGSAFHAQDVADTMDKCPWNTDNYGVKNNAAGQAWYDSMLAQYASWGLDYIKVDCIASHPYKGDEIAMIHKAIVKTGRPIVLSLSPGPAPLNEAVQLGQDAQLWRISDDVWDSWSGSEPGKFPQSVKNQFAVIASWTKYVKPGNWPDADMLPLGALGPVPGYGEPRNTKLTHDEQQTLLTLWSMARSPLFFGGNLTKLDEWTNSLLANPEVIAVDQRGHDQHLVSSAKNIVVWTSKGDGGVQYLAIFNLGDVDATVDAPLVTYGLAAGQYKRRDVWARHDELPSDRLTAPIPPHGCILLALRK
jgi:alpha-galactosidase